MWFHGEVLTFWRIYPEELWKGYLRNIGVSYETVKRSKAIPVTDLGGL
jgi:hypothetical protein